MRFLKSPLLFLALLLPAKPFAAYSYVGGGDWEGAIPLTFSGISLSSGDVVFAAVTYGSGTRIVESFSDGTNTWTYLGTQSNSGNGQSIALFICKNATAGSYTFTFNLASGAGSTAMGWRIYSGLDNAGSAQFVSNDQTNVATTANSITSGSITPAAQPGILFSYTFEITGSGSLPTAGSGTTRAKFATWDNLSASMTQDQRITALTSTAATFTASNATNNYLTIGAFYPEPGAAGSGSTGGFRSLLQVGH